ncbi:MAG: hypothetical protein ABS62_12855 [Microbacterium sp. SCN 70-200]|nr:MAG: hypothetical protein ABS62_12855 [Microbacterium sp. SCN 70-200]OJV84347.1 MAG: hypothetical protein BGO46_09675 [Microbacterium sp. 70-16]
MSAHARPRLDAAVLLTVYLVLLLGVPSNLRVAALGSIGRPSVLWGLVLIAFWIISRLQVRAHDVRPMRQPIRFAFLAFLIIALVSFASALLRGQPDDQVSPAITGIVRLGSWAGVLFVALDGIRTMNDLTRLARRLAVGVSLLAVLGLLQVLTRQSLIEFFGSIPGMVLAEDGELGARAGLVRATATAYHPLEYATTLMSALPLVIAAALSAGFRARPSRWSWMWWGAVALIAALALIGVSRSAIIGFLFVAVAMIPVFPRHTRAIVVVAGAGLGAAVAVLVPGLIGVTLALFTGAATDSSTQSRVGALDRAPEFIRESPLIGSGFGTFLPRYYIFDNEWAMIAVELGLFGAVAFVAIIAAAVWSAARARYQSGQPDVRLLGYSLIVSMLVISLMFAFFDALAFSMTAGLFFFYAGLCGALRNVGAADAQLRGEHGEWRNH